MGCEDIAFCVGGLREYWQRKTHCSPLSSVGMEKEPAFRAFSWPVDARNKEQSYCFFKKMEMATLVFLRFLCLPHSLREIQYVNRAFSCFHMPRWCPGN
jgi:hypothetical protein